MRRLTLLFLGFAILVLLPFLLWGEWFEENMEGERTVAQLKTAGPWAWAVGLGLLFADLFLPILGTAVMSALGLIYGWFLGGILSAVGAMGAGWLAYGLCRSFGRGIAVRIAGEKGLAEGERLFASSMGGWVVALSRWLPLLPEIVACMAGLSKMSPARFGLALACGCLPFGFAFAAIGEGGQEQPFLALGLSALTPPVLWAVARPLVLRWMKRGSS